MGASGTSRGLQRKLGRVLVVTVALVTLLLATAWLGLSIYLTTPPAARQVSRLLTDYLHCPVTVTGLRFSGGTLYARGLVLASPPGFAEPDLATARSAEIRPRWRALLSGKKDFAEITVTGLRVTLARNGKGAWNFSDLARLSASRKGGGETSLRRLTITDGSLALEGRAIDHVSLTVTDLSTTGTTDSSLLLVGETAGGARFRVEGSGRLGPEPSLDIVLSSPEIPLNNYRRSIPGGESLDLTKGIGSLSVGVSFRNGKVSAVGRLGFDRVALSLGTGALPLKAALHFSGRYDSRGDEASLGASTLAINDIVRVHASGTMHDVRKRGQFLVKISLERADLGRLAEMVVPPELRGQLSAEGVIHPAALTVMGDTAHGITGGKGAIRLSGGALSGGGQIWARELAAEISLAGGSSGWRASGRISQGKTSPGELLRALDAPFSALLSPRLKIVQAGVPSFSARVAGLPVTGRVIYRLGTAEPFTAGVDVRKASFASASRYLAGKQAAFSSGALTLDIHAAGASLRDFKGKLTGGVVDATGEVAGKHVTISKAAITASFGVARGKPSATGKLDVRGSYAGSGTVALTSDFGMADSRFSLSAGSVVSDRVQVQFTGIRGTLPLPVQQEAVMRGPFRMQLEGVSAQSGDARLSGLSGSVRMDYRPGRGKGRLTCSGEFAVSDLAFKGKKVGSLGGRLDCADSGITMQIEGILLDGRLRGTATGDPFDPRARSSFRLHLDGMKGTELTPFAPAALPVSISGGALDADMEGGYGAGEGLSCRVTATAAGISLADRAGKPLLSGGRLNTMAELKGDTLFVREGTIAAGDGVAGTFQGEVAHVFSTTRAGTVSLALPVTPLATLFHTFDALLPDKLRTATSGGTLEGKGRVRIREGNALLDGELSLEKIEIELPDQQLSLADATGTIPFSFVLSGNAGGTRQMRLTFRRENYDNLLALLRQAARKGANLTIGTIRFGPMVWGQTSLGIGAENGRMEITSFASSLFRGSLLGTGFVRSGEQFQYGIDLAVNGLSLRALCDTYPNIKGYISGKVDGIVSLYGGGAGLNGLSGFADIWTRGGPDEKMLVSKEFLQKLAGKNLKGFFFRNDRPYDRGEIRSYLENGYLTFEVLDISHTTLFGIRDLSVSVAPVQNKIALTHLIASIRAAATRGKAASGSGGGAPAPAATEFKWEE
jgi:hypothetical protein